MKNRCPFAWCLPSNVTARSLQDPDLTNDTCADTELQHEYKRNALKDFTRIPVDKNHFLINASGHRLGREDLAVHTGSASA